jgi:hypothetical protein
MLAGLFMFELIGGSGTLCHRLFGVIEVTDGLLMSKVSSQLPTSVQESFTSMFTWHVPLAAARSRISSGPDEGQRKEALPHAPDADADTQY